MASDDEDDADNLNDSGGKPHLNDSRRKLPVLTNLGECNEDSIRDQKLNAEDDENPERIPLSEVVFLLGKYSLQREFLSALPLGEMAQVLGQGRRPSCPALDALPASRRASSALFGMEPAAFLAFPTSFSSGI